VDDARITTLITELDALVPKHGAVVNLLQYGGGPDESAFVGNRAGYLRFGIEFLKGAFAPSASSKDGKDYASVDLDYLTGRTSDISFDWFERREDIPDMTTAEQATWVQGRLVPLLILAFLGICGVVFLIGLVTIVRWL
jgi:hypothetical protein